MTTIGIGKAKYFRFQKRRKDNPELAAYRDRNERLRMVGWDGYAAYMASDDWKRIRERRLRKHPACWGCGGAATQVHHWSYDDEVMFGAVPELLLPVCRACHEAAEFADGKKVSLAAANERLAAASVTPDNLRQAVAGGLGKLESVRRAAGQRRKERNREKRDSDRRKQERPAAVVQPPPAHLLPYMRKVEHCNNRDLEKKKSK